MGANDTRPGYASMIQCGCQNSYNEYLDTLGDAGKRIGAHSLPK